MRSVATIAGARRKNRHKEEGCKQDLLCVSRKQRDLGPAQDLEHSRAPYLRERLQGRRPLVPMCRSVGEAGDRGGGRDGDFAGDLFQTLMVSIVRALVDGDNEVSVRGKGQGGGTTVKGSDDMLGDNWGEEAEGDGESVEDA
ncbi:hypothetical protein BHE74_00042258 [Ensete ventricosum]|nr:hypothetical protein BHE74_00042258 [Ensete ventricosum]